MDKLNITKSALLGLATGDALGVPVEFLSRAEVRRINLKDMLGCDTTEQVNSHWGCVIPAGAWSDDTSLAVAGMSSIVCNGGQIDCNDVMARFLAWWEKGKYCSLSRPFGLGGTVQRALANYIAGVPAVDCGPADINANGNGSLMRILPFSLYCIFNELDDDDTAYIIEATSGITHGHPISRMGCVMFTVFLRELLSDKAISDAWEATKSFNYGRYYDDETIDAYGYLFLDEFAADGEKFIGETGYVVDTMATAADAMLHGEDFESCLLRAINMGYDTDTAGAVTGALAGAYYGVENIPERWLSRLLKRDKLEELARLFATRV